MSSSTFTISGIQNSALDRNFEPPPVKIVGYYSIDSERNYINGAQNLKYVQQFHGVKDVCLELNRYINIGMAKQHEYEIMPKRKEQNSRLFHFLEWINLHQEDFEDSRPDFVLQRDVLQKIFTTPYPSNPKYPNKEGWRVAAIKRGKTTYLRKILTSEDEPSLTPFAFQTTAWGLEFEKFVLSDEPNEQPDPSEIKSPGAQFNTVLEAEVGGYSVLYTAELDGVSPKEEFNLAGMNAKDIVRMLGRSQFIEVKSCSAALRWNKHDDFKKYMSRTWWVQAALGGISNMIIGYRDNQTGVVKYLENMPVVELYRNYRLGWYGEWGYKFLGDFLAEVKAQAVREDTVYIFEFKKGGQRCNQFEILFEIPQDPSEYMLPNLV